MRELQDAVVSFVGEQMSKSVKRLAVALFVLAAALAASPAAALADDGTCPGNIVKDGTIACHLTGPATDCKTCVYHCEDGTNPSINWCAPD